MAWIVAASSLFHSLNTFSFLYSHSAATSDSSTLAILKKKQKNIVKQNSKPIFGIFGFFSSGPWIIRYSAKKKYSDSIFGFQNFNIRIRLRSAEYSVFGSNTRIRIDIPAYDQQRKRNWTNWYTLNRDYR